MRSILLVSAILAVLARTLVYPFAGVILWTWFTLAQPQDESYSFARSLPLNLVIAVVTIGAWLLSRRERKAPPAQFLIWVTGAFLVWMTFNSFHAFNPTWSWPIWDRTWKTFALGFMIAVLATNRVRIHALIAVSVLSLFYYGVKGGMFTLLTGGVNHVLGAPQSQIGDNNALALALLMTIPLANYLRLQSANVWVQRALAVGIGLTIVSIVGSYSRGALIGLATLGLVWVLQARRKFLYLTAISVVAAGVAYFMPAQFWERAETIQSIQQGGYDASVHGRLVAWQVAYKYAHDHFPYGAGFYGPQLAPIYNHYFPDEKTHAAHSIYFQVLGEHGFIGLAIYLLIIFGAFWKCWSIMVQTRDRPDLAWARELARMIMMSLLVFCVVGAALSMAYYDIFVICLGLVVVVGEICTVPSAAHAARKRIVLQPAQNVAP